MYALTIHLLLTDFFFLLCPGGEVLRSTSSPSSTSSSSPVGHHDGEEDHGHHHKKSVLTKVKEKAKKLKHSLSNKKKHSEGDNSTPTWGASPVEHEDEEQDAEYLGAPSNNKFLQDSVMYSIFVPKISMLVCPLKS